MARIRTVKPEFFRSDQIAECSALARLLFIALWCLADRRGRLEDRPKRIKAECLPYDDADANELLAELYRAKVIVRYRVGDQDLIQIVTFERHQRITGSEADSESFLPPYSGNETDTKENHQGKSVELSEKHPGNTQETLRTTGKEGREGREGKEYIGRSETRPAQKLDLFDKLRSIYPKRSGSHRLPQAKAKFTKLATNGVGHERIIAGATRYRAWCDKTEKTGTEFVMQLATWLNQGCYDEPYDLASAKPSREPTSQEKREALYAALDAQEKP
jgi:hypothetical protein